MATGKTVILWPSEPEAVPGQTAFSLEFCRSYWRALSETEGFLWRDVDPSDRLGTCLEPENAAWIVYETHTVPSKAMNERMARVADANPDHSIFSPGYNLPFADGTASPLPFPYHNIRNFEEMADAVWATGSTETGSADPAAPSVLYLPAGRHGNLIDLSIADIGAGLAAGRLTAAVGTAVVCHRFGDMYGHGREELAALLPAKEHLKVLDVGCATGSFGRSLKQLRPDVHLTGVEMDPAMARVAAAHYDRVVTGRIEDFTSDYRFDVAVCGDVLEHTMDPVGVLRTIRRTLMPGGAVVGSVPNASHWSILMDLAVENRFEYVPVGLLCVDHVRGSTKSEI